VVAINYRIVEPPEMVKVRPFLEKKQDELLTEFGLDESESKCQSILEGFLGDLSLAVSVEDAPGNVVGIWLLAESPWDTEHFGTKIGKTKILLCEDFVPASKVAEMARAALRRSKSRGLGLVISRINSKRVKAIQLLESLGAFTTDTIVRLRASVGRKNAEAVTGITIEDATDVDLDQIAEISRSAFQFGHFYNDPHISRQRVDEMYVTWAVSHLHDENYKLHVAKIEETTIGFVLSKLEKGTTGEGYGIIDLLAVSPKFRNLKVGSALIDHAMSWMSSSVKSVLVITQPCNLAAMNLYLRKGFRIVSSEVTLHHWL